MEKELFLIIHNVRSAHNVGSLFRTADGMGVSKVFLTGYTGAPVDRFNRKDTKIAKVSLGAEDIVPWEKRDIFELIKELRENGAQIVALEQGAQSISLDSFIPKNSVVLIVGNEIEGVTEDVLSLCEAVVEIPMKGKKESLNVSNAGAIALWSISSN